MPGGARGQQASVDEPKTVTTTRATRSTIALSLTYPERIKPKQEIVVSPKVSGRVDSVRVDVGQRVRSGQVLFTLESQDFDAQARSQAALDSAGRISPARAILHSARRRSRRSPR